MHTALIVEDIPETGAWLQVLLERAFTGVAVKVCPTCAATRQFVNTNPVSLALVDINLPDGNGLDLIGYIRVASPNAYIITSTIFDDDEHIITALRNGAHGYLLKDSSEQVFIQKLRGILTGDPPLSPSIARRILQCFSQPLPKAEAVSTANTSVTETTSLSQRERDVLVLVAKGLSRKEVAELLGLSGNTVARYIRDVYQKLNISSRAEAAVEACRMGLVSTEAS
ncbi:response regulator [Candidatus Thiothrix anitrata]|jgi:DNA-binding NarL/FixJ family response regulator|uniref:Response regulator transcription factor n=1 Tax=Candidatus Thiothrix anitrata TaxID=2823902 RepID=A0ABX7X5N7_9GAMM|nr:response regulator transcription factor [Candidatus Thiothrix anitrata]QTR51169.1 response regulator transcription factor [Candidatus Thiothrix anitrata]